MFDQARHNVNDVKKVFKKEAVQDVLASLHRVKNGC